MIVHLYVFQMTDTDAISGKIVFLAQLSYRRCIMCQSQELYPYSPALQLLDPWMRKHLPKWDEVATRRLIQLAAGIFERKSVLIEEIARATAFDAAEQTR